MKKRELSNIKNETKDKGITIIPLRIFINDKGLAKIEIAVSKGKKNYDKREDLKEKDAKREIDRAMKY